MPETLDDRVAGAKPNQKISLGSSIDDLVSGVKSVGKGIKKGLYYTYYTAKAALGLAAGFAMGGPHALILPAGMAAGTALADIKNKEKLSFKKLANEVAIGGVLGGVLNYMFKGVAAVGSAVKSAYGTLASLVARGAAAIVTIPAFLGINEYLNRAFISDYKPQKVEPMKKIKGPMKWIVPPILANFSVVPEYLSPAYQMPIAAGISLAYGLLKSPPKKEEKEPQVDQNQLARALQQYAPG